MKNILRPNASVMLDNRVLKTRNVIINLEPELNPDFVKEVLEDEKKQNPVLVKDLDELFD